jgi:glycosyltransferase involved in cell wall biosynthesis
MKEIDADIYYQRSAGLMTGVVAAYCGMHGKKSVFAASGNPNFERNTNRIRFRRDRWIYEYGLRRVDRVLVQNEEQAKLCLMNFGRKSTLVPNCYHPPAVNRRPNPSEILWVGTIRNVKRPHLFLDLAALLPHLQFTMVGGPAPRDSGMYDEIRTRATSMANVNFAGFVPYAQIDAYFDRAALLLNTSESEGFPNTYLQAWSRGVVTISFADCGAGLNGAAVGRTVLSLQDMAELTTQLMQNAHQRAEEGARCLKHYQRNHTPDTVLDLYERVIEELLRP